MKYSKALSTFALLATTALGYIANETNTAHEQHITNLNQELHISDQRAEDNRLKWRVSFYLIHQDYQALQEKYNAEHQENSELQNLIKHMIQDIRSKNSELEKKIKQLHTQE